MAAINDLMARIQDPELRLRMEKEVKELTKHKKFGLVFENHVPEMTLPYSELCSVIKRNEMMRIVDTATGKKVESLNASSLVRNDIKHLVGQDDLNSLFAKYNQ